LSEDGQRWNSTETSTIAKKPAGPGKSKATRLAEASDELVTAFKEIAKQPGGREMLMEMGIQFILPIEEKVRRENPGHPTLAVIDERRKAGLLPPMAAGERKTPEKNKLRS
jgi:hypothetical protein